MNQLPWHFWVVVIVSVLWHGIGAIEFLAVQGDWQPYVRLITAEQKAFIADMPSLVVLSWALTAGAGLVGSVLMGLRFGATVPVLALSMLAALVQAVWSSFISDPGLLTTAGWKGTISLWISVLFTVFLWLYAREIINVLRRRAR